MLRTCQVALLLSVVPLVACSNDISTLHGTVGYFDGPPGVGKTVVISSGSFRQSVMTDSNGAFSVSNVPTPYDATVIDQEANLVSQYVGLSRTDPTLTELVNAGSRPARSATISGALVGGEATPSSPYDTLFVFASPETTYTFMPEVNSGMYSSSIPWSGPPSTVGVLYALQAAGYTPQGPSVYTGYGTRSVSLQDRDSLLGQDVTLSAVTMGRLSGMVSLAGGYNGDFQSMSLVMAPNVSMSLAFAEANAGAAFTFLTPDITSTSITVAAGATGPEGEQAFAQKSGLSANTSGVALNLVAAPSLLAPPDASVGVTAATPFSWTAYPNGVHGLEAYSESGPTFLVFTAATTATLPDATLAGIPFPASTQCLWSVIGLAPVASTDALAAAGGLRSILQGDRVSGLAAERMFTTGP